MGREVRMVPANWEHPKDDRGRYIPLHGGSFAEHEAGWNEEYAQWKKGFRRNYSSAEKWCAREGDELTMRFTEWHGRRPSPDDYMPDWLSSMRTHFQMYENTSEGAPISPVMDSAENLARWLADNGASSFGSMTAAYEAWLATINRGYAPSGMITDGGQMVSGVEGLAAIKVNS